MTLVLLVSERDHETYATPRRVRLRDRVSTRLHRFALDCALAQGVAPDRSSALALRAQQLLKPTVRRRAGEEIQQIVHNARHDPPRARHAIRSAESQLEELALRLLDDQPIAVCGVAYVRTLLRDGGSPLYAASGGPVELRNAIGAAVDALENYA